MGVVTQEPFYPQNTAAWETKSIPVNDQSISEDPDEQRTSIPYALGTKIMRIHVQWH